MTTSRTMVVGLFLAALLVAASAGAQPKSGGAGPQTGQQGPACGCGMGMGGTGQGRMDGMMCGQMLSSMAEVKVEETAEGAILRFTPKDPKQVDEVRKVAQRMATCMTTRGGSMQQPMEPPAGQQQQPAPKQAP